jgi:prepilin-type processing-associated H-X9-DG protein
MQCSNNLKQIGLAMHNYADVYGQFAIGTMHNDPANGGNAALWSAGAHRKGSVLTKILPQLEQNGVFDNLDFAIDVEPQLVAMGFASDKKMTAYICPSDGTTSGKLSAPQQFYNYAVSLGNQNMSGRGWCNDYPNNSYTTRAQGILGGNLFRNGPTGHGTSNTGNNISGVFSRTNWAAAFKDITDGTSNVIMIGEILPSCGDHHRKGWYSANSLWTATTAPINFNTCGKQGVPDNQQNCNDFRNWQTSQGFKSDHTGGAQFVFCDGSVHFLSETVNYLTYQQLGSRNDGEPLATEY